jgi:hypothetical protein
MLMKVDLLEKSNAFYLMHCPEIMYITILAHRYSSQRPYYTLSIILINICPSAMKQHIKSTG